VYQSHIAIFLSMLCSMHHCLNWSGFLVFMMWL